MNIGKFTPKADGKIAGKIETLTFAADLVFSPNSNKKSDEPDYRVYRGTGEVGAAWIKSHDNCGSYISVKLDAPTLPAALYVALFQNEDGNYRMVWDRKKEGE